MSVISLLSDISTGPNTLPEELVLDFRTRAHAAPKKAMPAKNALDNDKDTETMCKAPNRLKA